MLTDQEYREARARYDAYQAWRGDRTVTDEATRPADVPNVTNDETSAIEVYEFVRDVPASYFAYVSTKTGKLTTWTGDELGAITFGSEWRDNFGGTRQAIRVKAINGRTYSGTYFKSAGDYARLRIVKS
jgi:hypothetical protein